jgi:RHS repeat-associated protein
MGNILTQKRNGGGTSATALDELTYNYHTTTDGLVSNRLYQVNDVVSAGNYSDDIDDQGTFNNTHSTIETANNYGYDELGNLVRDVQEEIASIEWTVYGKMKKITRNSSSSKADLEFGYDASGNRLWKKVTPKGSGAVISTYYYLRDAQGNEMCRYVKYTNTSSQLMYVAQEHSIYGSSRVGVDGRKDTLYKAGSYSLAWGGVSTSRRELGLKSFELANHLGNVLVTVSDKPVYKVSSTTIFFQPEITSISDYYPFGTPINGRSFSSTEYRFGFNGKELDEESETQDYGMRINDCRLGRFLSVDPLVETTMQPYSAFNNNPIRYNDPTGMIAEDPGDIYSSDGKYLKNDGIDDKKVYVVDKSKIVTTEDGTRKWANNDQIEIKGVDHTDFLNRANWVYGEGGGNFTDHYAHTIQNLKEHGVWGPANKPFASDEAMFKSKMTHKNSSGKIVNMYPGYFDGTDGNVNSKAFANLRKDLYKLTSNEGMRASISSVIGSMMGTTQDPVNGAYQWVGGAGSQGGIAKNPTLNNATNVTNVTSGTGNGQRYHTFYSLLNE